MFPAILVLVAACGIYFFARYQEGEIIAEEFAELESMLASFVLALIVLFAFVIPEINGYRLPRWHGRLFICPPVIAWAAASFPSVFQTPANVIDVTVEKIRKTGLVGLTLLFVTSLFS
ncbi:hypothetical protein [Nevskia sp.]|uniref:hypothetical protein n=1 Tax=Nevskia sp. TaxID=1929292 RepID=UPI003F71CCF1